MLALALPLLLLLYGCGSTPSYATQRGLIQHNPPRKHSALASDPSVSALLAADIGPLEDGRFRWTGANPEVKLELPTTRGLHLYARFWLSEDSLKKTGPVQIAYLINGAELSRVTYTTGGEQTFDQPADPNLLNNGANTVRMSIDKTIARSDGTRMGVALVELGFID